MLCSQNKHAFDENMAFLVRKKKKKSLGEFPFSPSPLIKINTYLDFWGQQKMHGATTSISVLGPFPGERSRTNATTSENAVKNETIFTRKKLFTNSRNFFLENIRLGEANR